MSDPSVVPTQVPEEIISRVADPRLIDELFNLDPLKLTDADLDLIIAELRKDRQLHLAAAAAPKSKKTAAGKQAQIPLGDINLADLGLD